MIAGNPPSPSMTPAPIADPSSPSTAPAIDPLQRLRAATSALHARLDTGLPIAREGAGPDDYMRHLALLRGWVGLLQQSGAASRRLDDERDALDAELADCQRLLGRPAPRVEVRAVPDAALTADGADWGLAYVLEGSRLGGQVLHKRLAPAMAPLPLTYLRGAAAGTGPRWKQFVAELKEALTNEARMDAAAAAARHAFELLLRCHEALPTAQGESASRALG